MRTEVWCRAAFAALALLFAALSGNARATPAPAATPAPVAAPHPHAAPFVPTPNKNTAEQASPDDLKQLAATLQDDQRRAVLIRQIQALIAVEQAAQAPPHPSPTSALVDTLKTHVQNLAEQLVAAEGTVIDAPVLWSWFQSDMADPHLRHVWWVVFEKLVVIFAAALAADWLVRGGFSRLRRANLGLTTRGWFSRATLLLLHLLIDLLPPLAFAAVALMALPFVNAKAVTIGVTTAAIEAVLIARALLIAARTLLIAPYEINARFLPISEETANYIYIWTRRFVCLSVYGFSIGALAALLDVPDPVIETFDKLVALLITILAIVFVIQNRGPVAYWLRPRPREATPETDVSGDHEATEPPPGPLRPRHPVLDFLRHRLADIWHALATVYIAGVFVVYALSGHH